MGKSKKRRKIVVFAIIGLTLLALTALALLKKREVVVTVQTEKVARRNLTEIVVANGKVQPVVQVKISPEVSGEIIELPVKEGQAVKRGDLIVKIKPEFYIAQLHQGEAGYQSSLAAKATAEASLRKAEAEFKRNARRFLYYQLFRTSLPFGDFLEPSVRTTQTRLKSFSLEKLKGSEAVKVFLKGLLEGGDFLLKE